MTDPAHIMIIDDDVVNRRLTTLLLARQGYHVASFTTAAAGLAYLAQGRQPQLLIIDLILPDMHGLDFLDTLRKRGHVLPALIFTAAVGTKDTVIAALRRGCVDYLEKPLHPEQLEEHLHQAIHGRQCLSTKILPPGKPINSFLDALKICSSGGIHLHKPQAIQRQTPLLNWELRQHLNYEACTDFVIQSQSPQGWELLFIDLGSTDMLAAYHATLCQCYFQTQMSKALPGDEFLRILNSGIYESGINTRPLQAMFLRFSASDKCLRIAHAGTPPPLLSDPRHCQSLLHLHGEKLGIGAEPQLDYCTLRTDSGTRLLLHSDGLGVTAPDLLPLLAAHRQDSLAEVIKRCWQHPAATTNAESTLLILEVN